jgi:hypothetical protein
MATLGKTTLKKHFGEMSALYLTTPKQGWPPAKSVVVRVAQPTLPQTRETRHFRPGDLSKPN